MHYTAVPANIQAMIAEQDNEFMQQRRARFYRLFTNPSSFINNQMLEGFRSLQLTMTDAEIEETLNIIIPDGLRRDGKDINHGS